MTFFFVNFAPVNDTQILEDSPKQLLYAIQGVNCPFTGDQIGFNPVKNDSLFRTSFILTMESFCNLHCSLAVSQANPVAEGLQSATLQCCVKRGYIDEVFQ